MSKPSLHELISNEIYKEMLIIKRKDWTEQTCDELAEQIIKIVRDYHLVEDCATFEAMKKKENK